MERASSDIMGVGETVVCRMECPPPFTAHNLPKKTKNKYIHTVVDAVWA